MALYCGTSMGEEEISPSSKLKFSLIGAIISTVICVIAFSYLYFMDIEYRGENYSQNEEVSISGDSTLMLYVSSEEYDCESNKIFVSSKGGPGGWHVINEDSTPLTQECNSVYNRNNWKFVGYLELEDSKTYRLNSDFSDESMEFASLDPVNPMLNPTTPSALALIPDFLFVGLLFFLISFRKSEIKSENDAES